MRIHFFTKYDRRGASSRYRTYLYQPYLQAAGIETRIFPLFSEDYLQNRYSRGRLGTRFTTLYRQRWQDMVHTGDCDLTVIEKELLPYLPLCCEKKAIQAAHRLILDYDDAIFANYLNHRNPLLRWSLKSKISELMALSHGVTVGSPYLGEYACQYAPRVWSVPTTVEVEKYTLHEHHHEGLLSIGWIGTPWSSRYLKLLQGVLPRVASDIEIRFLTVGAEPPYLQSSHHPSSDDGTHSIASGGAPGIVSALHFQCVPWSEETETERIQEMDIGVMPVVDSPFERGKCGLKILQYMAAGVVPVASDVGANRELICHGVDGLLCRTEEEWVEAILELAHDPDKRALMGQAGRKKVAEYYALSVWAPKLIAIFREVTNPL